MVRCVKAALAQDVHRAMELFEEPAMPLPSPKQQRPPTLKVGGHGKTIEPSAGYPGRIVVVVVVVVVGGAEA